jgi:hypothetical protein
MVCLTAELSDVDSLNTAVRRETSEKGTEAIVSKPNLVPSDGNPTDSR